MADEELVDPNPSSYPVSSKFKPIEASTIYRTDEWWKGIVTFRYTEASDTTSRGRAVYLWHREDGTWKKKQEYLINSIETWQTDREYIEELLATESGDPPKYDFDEANLPASDYFTVGDAVTVFKTDEWWKAVVRIDAKGEWTTREVIVYVWQYLEGKWRRRQKYAIKRRADWEEEAEILSRHLEQSFQAEAGREGDDTDVGTFDPEQAKEDLRRQLKMHELGGEFN